MIHPFNPEQCDLCESTDYQTLFHSPKPRAMFSDRRIVSAHLEKNLCLKCGLVRSGSQFSDDALADLYQADYQLTTFQEEHHFYASDGTISRSEVFRDWIINAMGKQRWQAGSRCLEVGAGAGFLLDSFQKHFPDLTFEGIELSDAAVAAAQSRGLAVTAQTVDDLPENTYDIVYTIAVLEHVPSPTEFLQSIKRVLRPNGLLFLCQPTQDVITYDVLFYDHLHHFGSEHIHRYATKCGFRELDYVVGHSLMPNFSLHCWQMVDDPVSAFTWHGPPAHTSCVQTIQQLTQDFQQLDSHLVSLRKNNHRVAVFGLSEAYQVIRTYSSLEEFPIVCGLVDDPSKVEYEAFEFPVIKPEEHEQYGVQDVLLTMNAVYYNIASNRLKHMNLNPYPILSR